MVKGFKKLMSIYGRLNNFSLFRHVWSPITQKQLSGYSRLKILVEKNILTFLTKLTTTKDLLWKETFRVVRYVFEDSIHRAV